MGDYLVNRFGDGDVFVTGTTINCLFLIENFAGEKGKGGMAIPDPDAPVNTANATRAARDLGQGWKVNPFIIIKPGETFTLAEIEGPGAIQQIWITPTGNWRFSILRFYWDDEAWGVTNNGWWGEGEVKFFMDGDDKFPTSKKMIIAAGILCPSI